MRRLVLLTREEVIVDGSKIRTIDIPVWSHNFELGVSFINFCIFNTTIGIATIRGAQDIIMNNGKCYVRNIGLFNNYLPEKLRSDKLNETAHSNPLLDKDICHMVLDNKTTDISKDDPFYINNNLCENYSSYPVNKIILTNKILKDYEEHKNCSGIVLSNLEKVITPYSNRNWGRSAQV